MTDEENLCTRLLLYAAISSPRTGKMTGNEIIAAVSVFFTDDVIKKAVADLASEKII